MLGDACVLAFEERRDGSAGLLLPVVTPSQLEGWKTECWARDLSPAPEDRAEAEEGVRRAYIGAGLLPPPIVWCDGPVELIGTWARTSLRDGVGASVRSIVFDAPYRRAIQRFAARAADGQAGWVQSLFARDPSRVVSAAIQAAIMDEMGGAKPRLMLWLKHYRRCPRELSVGSRPVFQDCGNGPLELRGASLAAQIEEALDGNAAPDLRSLRLIAENAGWLVAHEGVCWLSRRPDVVSTDRQLRLHCALGPALRYPDGWALYAWKGVLVPAWVVTQTDRITLRWIDAEIDPQVRHAMIDIFTPRRFIAEGGADPVVRDEAGTLWKRKWTHRCAVIDTWTALEVAGQSGMFWLVPAHLRTPRQALAWLRGPQGN